MDRLPPTTPDTPSAENGSSLDDRVASYLRGSVTPTSPEALTWLAAVAVIGSLVLSAYEISQRSKNASSENAAIDEMRAGFQDLRQRMTAIEQKLDDLAKALTELFADLKRFVDAALYAQLARVQFGNLATARQTIDTFTGDAELTWQNMTAIRSALLDIQRSVNTFLSGAGGAKVDEHLVIAPWVSLWRQTWDTTERVWKSKDANHVVVDSSRHGFYRDYSLAVTAILTRCGQVERQLKGWLATTVFPAAGSYYDFDPATKVYTRGPLSMSGNQFKIDPYYYTNPYFWSVRSITGGPTWKNAALRVGSTWARNPDLGAVADTALQATLTAGELADARRVAIDTLAQIQDSDQLLVNLDDALRPL